MPDLKIQFGFYPENLSIDLDNITIKSIKNHNKIIVDFKTECKDLMKDQWIYAPLARRSGFENKTDIMPYTSRVFSLPKTHEISHSSATNPAHLDFHVWCLSFFKGIRLTTTEAGFLDATSMEIGELVDFHADKNDLLQLIQLAEECWLKHQNKLEVCNLFRSAIHAFFIAQYPRLLEYEKFLNLYMALNCCQKIFALTQSKSDQSMESICNSFKVPIPDWAHSDTPNHIKKIRNNLVHEAFYLEEPLGFVAKNQEYPNIINEMKALVSRFLVALIGASQAGYVKTSTTTRQNFGLDLT